MIEALHGARLLVPVVAVLGEAETGDDGLRREKSSDMAVPTIQAPDGRRALPAFTSVAALARWRPDARPVAVPLPQALRALAHEGADTLLIDLAGPVTYELTGPSLRAAAGSAPVGADPIAEPAVREALRAAVARRTRRRPGPPRPRRPAGDGTLGLVLEPGTDVQETATQDRRRAGRRRGAAGRAVRGLDLALLPPDADPPGEPLFTR